jgi:hypothetical protein
MAAKGETWIDRAWLKRPLNGSRSKHLLHRPAQMLHPYVADQEGYFEDEGVHVALRDGTRWETERLRAGATIGLDRALLSRLADGIQWTVLAVNTHHPLFWFLGRGEVKSMDDLRGRRLAIHEAHTAPGCFARIALRKFWTPIATWNAWREPRVTTRRICDAFATARSMRPTWAAR